MTNPFSASPTSNTPATNDSSGDSYVDAYSPPTFAKASAGKPAGDLGGEPSQDSQALEDQNIFDLLGITDGTDKEKEEFLDELQQVIWDDFVANDVSLLLTQDEMGDFDGLDRTKEKTEEEHQIKLINFLEKLVPDLEDIMLEKALELKEDMVKERIAGMRDFYAGKADQLQKIDEAEKLIDSDQWHTGASTLNSIR